MEFMEERTPPLPQNTENLNPESKVIKMMNFGSVRKDGLVSPKDSEVEISKASHDENNLFVPQKLFLQSSEVPQVCKTNSNLKCWADNKSALSSEEIYENIFFNVNSHCKHGAKNDNIFFNEKEEKRKSPEIEVRQEDNKTVVKISIKDFPSPEQDLEDKGFNGNIYENGYVGRNGFIFSPDSDASRIENYEYAKITSRQLYENLPEKNFQEAVSDECFYENLSEKNRYYEPKPVTKANHGKLNEGNSKCNQVYENDFELTKNKTRKIKNSIEHEKKNDDLYETIENNCPLQYDDNPLGNGQKSVTVERRKSEKANAVKKSSFADLKLFKSDHFTDFKCSSDVVDSDTCSDVEGFSLVNNIKKGVAGLNTRNLHNDEMKKNEVGHKRAESLTSSGVGIDSEESDDENSNISCDSLNSSDPYLQSNSEDNGYHTPNSEDKLESPVENDSYENMIKKTGEENKEEKESDFNNKVSKETDIIKQQPTDIETYFSVSDFEEYENVSILNEKSDAFKRNTSPPPPPPPPNNLHNTKKNFDLNISSSNVRLSSTYPNGESHQKINLAVTQAIFNLREKSKPKKGLVEEKTYEERKNNIKSSNVNKICAMEVDTDKFYKFHLSEKFLDGKENEEETFAGIKDYLSREKPAAITSAKGTIRGVKNRVKAGIATFLQMHENKSYKDKDAGKVVVYTTTMGIVRETYHKCLKVKQILKTLMVKFEERDVFMSIEAQQEIRDRMKCNIILVPQVFVEGQHVGDAETIERLNEIGELRIILKPYKSVDSCSTCNVCGGYRLLPCKVCKGSKKSIHRNHFTMEFVSLKCMNCDQVGLTKCNAC